METLKLIFDGVEDFKSDLKKSANTQFYFVGGCVRDYFLGRKSKDIDIIIPHINFNILGDILSRYGDVKKVGESFPVYKFMPNGFDGDEPIDVAVPRIERSTGDKHTEFETFFDETVTLEDDLKRRDFTINAIAMDSDGHVIDLFGGLKDLKSGLIKIITEHSFTDDPLRILRAVQFCSRFRFDLSDETFDSMFKNRDSLKHISPERIRIEIEKGLKHESNRHDLVTLLSMVLPIGKNMMKIGSMSNIGELNYVEFIDALFNQDYSKEQVDKIIKLFYLNADEKAFILQLSELKRSDSISAMDLFKTNRKSGMLIDSDYVKGLFPQLQEIIQKFRDGVFPRVSKDLAVDGEFFMSRGIKGIEIGKAQNDILELIFSGVLQNDKKQIEEFIDETIRTTR